MNDESLRPAAQGTSVIPSVPILLSSGWEGQYLFSPYHTLKDCSSGYEYLMYELQCTDGTDTIQFMDMGLS